MGLVGQWSAAHNWPGGHHYQLREGWCQVPWGQLGVRWTPWRGPRQTLIGFLLIGSVFLVSWRWSLLNWHAKGMILAAYGVILLLVVLLPALRLLKSGGKARGTVVGAEQKTGIQNVTYYPRVQFITPDGRTVVFTSTFGSTSKPDVGRSLPVRYLLEDPEQAEIDSAIMWGFRALVILSGLGLLVAGVVQYLHQ